MSELSPIELETVRYYNSAAKAWAAEHQTNGFWEEEMEMFHKLLPNGRLLEIGSGGGRDAAELVRYGYEYTGTDISEGLLIQARQTNPELEFQNMSVYDLEFDEPFDGFWCSAVLLHVPRNRISEALQSIKSVVKNKAVGFISLKAGEGEKQEPSEDSNLKRFFSYWDDTDFSAELKAHKFDVIHHGSRPMSERTRWLTYIVQKNDRG